MIIQGVNWVTDSCLPMLKVVKQKTSRATFAGLPVAK